MSIPNIFSPTSLYKKPGLGYFPTRMYWTSLIANLRKMTFPTDSTSRLTGSRIDRPGTVPCSTFL